MPRFQAILKSLIAPSVVGAAVFVNYALAAEPTDRPPPKVDPDIQLVQQPPDKIDVPPEQPAPAPTPTPPAPTPTPTTSPLGAGAGGAPAAAADLSAEQRSAATAPGSNVVSGAEAQGRASGDLGFLLGSSTSSLGVIPQHRTLIVSDPRIRGYHFGQIFTQVDGAIVWPARADLDTIVSNIDVSSIRSVVIIKGPYAARYGPGFAFLDVATLDTPRFEQGLTGRGSTSLLYKTNAEQWRGRQAIWGGSTDWGFRVSYDIGTGNDYDSGNGTVMPSSYNAQNYDFAFGYDITPDSNISFRALRVVGSNIEFPGQIFDISRSLTDNYSARYTLKNQDCFDQFVAEGWYGYTRFDGNNLGLRKRLQIPTLDNLPIDATGSGIAQTLLINPDFRGPFSLLGYTSGDMISPGFRSYVTWGKEKEHQLTLGVDLIYQSTFLNEFDTFTGLQPFFSGNNPIPRSHSVDPGIFIEDILPLTDRLTLKSGFRVDIVSTDVDQIPTGLSSGSPTGTTLQEVLGTNDFSNQFNLWHLYFTGEYKLNDHWTGTGGLGLGQRPPTPTELYAAGPFLGVIQNGFNSVFGNPRLAPEQAWQIDLGVRAEYERLKAGANLFYSWIHNYITFEELTPSPFPVVKYVNTDQAVLSGAELYGSVDATDWLRPFATMSYVEGLDKTRDRRGSTIIYPRPATPQIAQQDQAQAQASFVPQEPLPGIPPLDSRFGILIHDPRTTPRWGVELSSRVVAAQDRVALSLREVATPGFTIWDLRTYWRPSDSLLLLAGVENFGNKNYREHLDLRTGADLGGPGVLEPGVNFYFGARVDY